MLLTAQRVIAPDGRQGVNAFYYRHGAPAWIGRANEAELARRAELVNTNVALPPPGNRVRSYLDIWAPDFTPTGQVFRDVVEPLDLLVNTQQLPWNLSNGNTTFKFDLEADLAPGWYSELTHLLECALHVRV